MSRWLSFGLGDVSNDAGSPVVVGSVVQGRPSMLYLSRWVPWLLVRLMVARSIGLWALSLPVTALAVVAAVGFEALGLGLVWQAVKWLAFGAVAWFGAFGAVAGVGVLAVAAVLGRFWLVRRFPNWDSDPWVILALVVFVGLPIMFSPFGLVLLVVFAVEKAAGVWVLSVRVWQQAWQVRRRWPMVWATMEARTARPQASHSGGSSPLAVRAKESPRPLLEHPALGLVPDFSQVGSVAWRVFAPNGRRVKAVHELAVTIAEQYAAVKAVEVSAPESDGLSWGTVRFWFADRPDPLEGVEGIDFDVDVDGDTLWDAPVSPGHTDSDPVWVDVDTGERVFPAAAEVGTVVLGDIGDEPLRGVA